jgi:uncharacterized protein (DUF58 family)
MLALALSLALAAAFSLMLLELFVGRSIRIEPADWKLKGFKNETIQTTLRIRGVLSSWVALNFASVGNDYLGSQAHFLDKHTIRLKLAPRYAGRLEGLQVNVLAKDSFGLFLKHRPTVEVALTIDVLPLSLVSAVRKVALSPLALGEKPSGAHGGGQEVYSLDTYNPDYDAKNIAWKRVARNPDEKLVVKMRESNIPELFTLGVVDNLDGSGDRPYWTDLVCEALGTLGRSLIDLGVDVELIAPSGQGIFLDSVEDLSEAILIVSSSKRKKDTASELILRSDIVITNEFSMEDPGLLRLLFEKPRILLSRETSLFGKSRNTVHFSGSENVLQILGRALER